MEWGASRILALRKHAGMTQAQIAQWLGVTIKQVKYLEHQRRNPSGPTRRLLGILAVELSFDEATPVQVLGASTVKRRVQRPVPVISEVAPANSSPPQVAPVHPHPDPLPSGGRGDVLSPGRPAVRDELESPTPAADDSPLQPEAEQSPGDGAFVWE